MRRIRTRAKSLLTSSWPRRWRSRRSRLTSVSMQLHTVQSHHQLTICRMDMYSKISQELDSASTQFKTNKIWCCSKGKEIKANKIRQSTPYHHLSVTCLTWSMTQRSLSLKVRARVTSKNHRQFAPFQRIREERRRLPLPKAISPC